MEYWKFRNDCFHDSASKINKNLKKDYAERFSETTGTEIQSQHWGGYFPNSVDQDRN